MQNEQVISYKEATGVIQYNMTNDYMFRYILQKNQKVLKGLICVVLLINSIEDRNTKKRFPSFTSDFWITLYFRTPQNFTHQTC